MRLCFVTVVAGLAAIATLGRAEAQAAEKYALRKDLSGFHRAVTTKFPEAQQYFDQGLTLYWGYNHFAAVQSFKRAQEIDPKCAMAYWGEAISLGPNINVPMYLDDEQAKAAFDALLMAKKFAKKSSPVERVLIPLSFIANSGLNPERDFEVVLFELLAGLHGDHIGGERDAVLALMQGNADAACILGGNLQVFVADGTLRDGATRVIARTPKYDHCNFTILDGAPENLMQRFRELLLKDELFRSRGKAASRPGRLEEMASRPDARL